jgi:hypothetical protein
MKGIYSKYQLLFKYTPSIALRDNCKGLIPSSLSKLKYHIKPTFVLLWKQLQMYSNITIFQFTYFKICEPTKLTSVWITFQIAGLMTGNSNFGPWTASENPKFWCPLPSWGHYKISNSLNLVGYCRCPSLIKWWFVYRVCECSGRSNHNSQQSMVKQ